MTLLGDGVDPPTGSCYRVMYPKMPAENLY